MRSPFLYEHDDDYQRDFSVIATYINDTATYISIRTGKPLEYCKAWVEKSLAKGGKHELRSPKAKVLDSTDNGNRVMRVVPYAGIVNTIVKRNKIVSPSFTVYSNPAEKVSIHAEYINQKLKSRKKAKSAMFAADRSAELIENKLKEFAEGVVTGERQLLEEQLEKDTNEKQYQNALQTSEKTGANSLSGVYGFRGTVLFNKTAHSALTSHCRCASGNANSNNERFLSANRHYWSVNIALNNIVNVVTHSNYPLIEKVLEKYNIAYPTVEQTLRIIKSSTDYYWRQETEFARVAALVEGLTPLQRAAFIYTQDAHSLMTLNDDVMRTFIGRLIAVQKTGIEDAAEWVGKQTDDLVMLTSIMRSDLLRGLNPKELKAQRPDDYAIYGATVKNVMTTLEDYSDLIKAFWATDNVPFSLAMFPSSMRRTAVVSDTDSTIFTVQDWTTWYSGKLDFTPESNAVSAVMVYFTSQCTTHILAKHSANVGVAREHLWLTAMKSEFWFPVLCTTPRGKHYWAYIGAREGNVYSEFKLDVKGMALRNSKIPPNIREDSDNMMKMVMDSVIEDKKLDVFTVMKRVADLEREIIRSVKSGEPTYLSTAKVRPASGYKNGEANSTFHNYAIWENVFAPKYGHAPPPTYDCIKVNLDGKKATNLREWLAAIEDRPLATRLENELTRLNKKAFTQILLPQSILKVHGLPVEVIEGLDTKKMLANLTDAHYLILSTMGIYLQNKKNTQLLSDFY